jgi:hypothetical protein
LRVLFDHNLPHKLRTELSTLSQHEIVTASYMGWQKLKNGELLQMAEETDLRFSLAATRRSSMSRV